MRVYTILHAIETGGPGGAETVLRDLVSNLDPARFRSLVVLPEGSWLPSQLRERNVPHFIVNSRAWYDLKLPREMIKVVRGEQVDLIHSHLPDQNFYSCLVGRLMRRPVVVTYHGAPWLSEGDGARRAFKSWFVARSANAVVTVSDYLKSLFTGAGFPAKRMTRIYNGVDLSRFTSAGSSRLRAELGCPATARLVGMVANLRRAKGYEYFVRAAAKIVADFPEIHFVAAGEIDERIGARIRGLIQELGLEGKFSLLGFRPNVAEVLKDLDVFVLSSVSEGLSIATIEAMAAGKAVVVTRSGGPEEIVEDNETGLLVPAANADTLASGIGELLRDPAKARRLGENARAAVERTFSMKRMVADYEAVYLNLLASR